MSGLTLAFGAFVAGVACHSCARRLWRYGAVPLYVGVTAIVGAILAVMSYEMLGFGTEWWSTVLLFGVASELYLFLFTLSLASISATLLLRIRDKPASVREILSGYDSNRMVQLRLRRLQRAGLITAS